MMGINTPISDSDLESEYRRGYRQGASKVIGLIFELAKKGYVRPVEIANILEKWETTLLNNWSTGHETFLPPELQCKPWPEIKQEAHTIDNGRCIRCGSDKRIEAHHVVKVMDGGRPEIDNIITLCFDCHRSGGEH